MPEIYQNHKTIIDFEVDARVGGEGSPFNKGVGFGGFFLKEFYKMKSVDEWKYQRYDQYYIRLQSILVTLTVLAKKELVKG